MKDLKHVGLIAVMTLIVAGACSKKGETPTAPTPAAPTLTTPALASPADGEQLDVLRPALTVRNATSDQTGSRSYEFQISDSGSFTSATTSNIVGFAATVGKTGVPEGANGTTTFTPEQDLQPTTVFYWRARALQGTATSAWSPTGRFSSRLVGFLRAGELYDPLIHGETVGARAARKLDQYAARKVDHQLGVHSTWF